MVTDRATDRVTDRMPGLAQLIEFHKKNSHILRSVLEPIVARYRGDHVRKRYFRGDAAFANPDIYEFLEQEGYEYAIRLKSNSVLQQKITHLLTRPVGRPPRKPIVWYDSFMYQAESWTIPRRVVAKVEWHRGELFPRIGFIVTTLRRSDKAVVKFYNGRGIAEQWIKEGKNAVKWTRLFSMRIGWTTADAPAIQQMLRISAPMMSPTAMPPSPLRAAATRAAMSAKSGGWSPRPRNSPQRRRGRW